MKIQYPHHRPVSYEVAGARRFGPDEVLLAGHDDLTQTTDWAETGYQVAPFLSNDAFQTFMSGVQALFQSFFQKAGISMPEEAALDQYHQLTHFDDVQHLAIVNQAKLLENKKFPIPVRLLEERVSELCRVPVKAHNPHNNEQVFHFRIIRPQRNDNNPLHRDVWLPEYHDAINIYVPVCGSNTLSSLTLVPGSHQWREAMVERTIQGAKVGEVQFNVPAVTDARASLELIRPDPKTNEVLVFSPYLVHGGAINFNEDVTRISLEMRFWRSF
ncbi:MAG: hypothetical protein RIG62_15045 [Cyclobacteriaceae bacterium]